MVKQSFTEHFEELITYRDLRRKVRTKYGLLSHRAKKYTGHEGAGGL